MASDMEVHLKQRCVIVFLHVEKWHPLTVVVGILRGYRMYGTGLSLSIERQCYRADLDAEKTGEEER